MHHIMILGAGRIGRLIACLLSESGDYQVTIADSAINELNQSFFEKLVHKVKLIQLDVNQETELMSALDKYQSQAIVSCLPYFCNVKVAKVAKDKEIKYFDLTEDTAVTQQVNTFALNSKNPFIPQCGLAPGFISIVANHLMQQFEVIEAAYLRVGALPVYPNNVLKYNLTWSTEGLINECGNPGYGLQNGEEIKLQPLEGLETLQIDGLLYEAFNTSGGLGSLAQTYYGKIKNLNYKSLRYPGHCQAMRLLMNDLKLNQDRKTLKRILENAIPTTEKDVVVIYVAVRGYIQQQYTEKTYVNKIYPMQFLNQTWSAIQVTTAHSACAIIDEVMTHPNQYQGLIKQEQFSLARFLKNRFGQIYDC